MMPPVKDATWADIARTQGIAWVLLLMIVSGIGIGIREIYLGMPQIIQTLESGYKRNLEEMKNLAQLHVEATAANRAAIEQLTIEIRIEHVRERQLLIELFKSDDVSQESIKRAIEESDAVKHELERELMRHEPLPATRDPT